MDAREFQIRRQQAEDGDKLLVLAKVVHRMLQDPPLTDEERSQLTYKLNDAFDYNLYE